MARVARLAGALLVETRVAGEPAWFLVGDTKVPCDWAAAGFARPAERDVRGERWVRLEPTGAPSPAGPSLVVELEGDAAAQALAERLTIERNGSVSERLWRLIVGEGGVDAPAEQPIEARWLCEVPAPLWEIVRDTVLKCT